MLVDEKVDSSLSFTLSVELLFVLYTLITKRNFQLSPTVPLISFPAVLSPNEFWLHFVPPEIILSITFYHGWSLALPICSWCLK